MTNHLQQIRKDAGYRSGREFADACGFSASSVARYERDPESIPIKAAWKIADVLECTVDDVIGREAPGAMELRGEVQLRFDRLAPARQAMLKDYLDLLERQQAEWQAKRKADKSAIYRQLFKTYFGAFLQHDTSACMLPGQGGGLPEDRRQAFCMFAYDLVDADYRDSEDVATEEVMDGIMQAYDDYCAGEFWLP